MSEKLIVLTGKNYLLESGVVCGRLVHLLYDTYNPSDIVL